MVECDSESCISKSDTYVGEEAKIEPTVIKNSIRNFYKLDMQKVTMQVELEDPSKPVSENNTTRVKGQAVLMLNRLCDEDSNNDATRDLRLDLHCKHISVLRISLAKRYKKKDENMKVSESLHERKEDLSFKYQTDDFEKFRTSSMYNEKHEKKLNYEYKDNLEDSIKARPCIQNFEENLCLRFRQEKRKGLLTIDRILYLEPGQNFPQNVDCIIDYEIDEVSDYGLSYRKTNEPSGRGCYLATTHRYFETHYWMPCIDSLKHK